MQSQERLVLPSGEIIFNFLSEDGLTKNLEPKILKGAASKFKYMRYDPTTDTIKRFGNSLQLRAEDVNNINEALTFCAKKQLPNPLRSNVGPYAVLITQCDLEKEAQENATNIKRWAKESRERLRKKNENFVYTPSKYDTSSAPYMPDDYDYNS